MPITLRQASGNTVQASTNATCTVNLGTPTLPSSLVFVVATTTHPRENFGAFAQDPAGFTRVFSRKEDKTSAAVWQWTGAPSMNKVAVQSGGETYGVQVRVLELPGIAQSSAQDKFTIGGDNPEGRPGSDTPNSGNTGTTTQADELVIGFIVNRYGSTTQFGFSGGLARLSESLSYDGEPDHDQTRLTIHAGVASATGTFSLGGRLSTNRDWIAGLITFKGGSLGPARMTSRSQPPAITIGGRGALTAFGPLVSKAQPPAIKISGRGWIGPFNYQYLLGGRTGLLIGDGTPYRTEDIQGLEGWTMRTADEVLARGDGERRGEDYQAARQIMVALKVGGTQLEVEQQMYTLYKALVPQRDTDWEFIWRHPGRPLRMLRCRPVDLGRGLSWIETLVNHQKVMLKAVDPRHYSLREREVVIPVTPAGSDIIVTAVSVINEGNANAYPVIRIRGAPGIDVTSVQLINATSDARYEVNTVISPTAELVGDMPARITSAPRSIIALDGQSKYGSWVYPREPFYLAPDPVAPGGVNALYLRTVPAGAPVTCTLSYRDTWAG